MAERCAVIGVGQTHHKAKRDDVHRRPGPGGRQDGPGRRDLTWSDIDAVVIGKAPDMFGAT